MQFVDKQFVDRVSPYLRNFKWLKNGTVGNCSCPLCGDSKKKTKLARGFFHAHEDTPSLTLYTCHNCGKSIPLKFFIDDQFPHLSKEFALSKFGDSTSSWDKQREDARVHREEKKMEEIINRKDIKYITSLGADHPSRRYLESRKIPFRGISRLGWANSFKQEVYRLCGDPNVAETASDDPRIVIPLRTPSGDIMGVQGRCLYSESSLRYQTILFTPESKRLFGLELLDHKKPVFMTEGPLDSFFVDNCGSMCGADPAGLESSIFIYDNEPRNIHIVNRIKRRIDSGGKIVLFPNVDTRYKDINSIVLNLGWDRKRLMDYLHTNTSSGIAALMELKKWQKVY